jgi:uncharacterized membrane protein (UPF0127 family)
MGFILPQEKILFPLENLSSVFLIFLGGWVVTCIVCFISLAVTVLATNSKEIKFSRGEINFYNQHQTIKVEIANTKAQLEKGLMFREKLADNQGMLLMFKQEEITKIWMKNMLIPLDIIFISSQNQVVSILKNIPPCLKSPCNIYKSNAPSKTVLELNAGKIDQYKIKIGDKVALSFY